MATTLAALTPTERIAAVVVGSPRFTTIRIRCTMPSSGSLVRSSIDPDAPAPRWLGTRTVYGYAADPHCEPPPPEVLRAQTDAEPASDKADLRDD